MTLTKSDLAQIKSIVEETVDAKLEEKLEAKLDAKLEEKLSNYPTKDEFYAETSKILAALNKNEEEDAAHKLLHNNLGEDIPTLQTQVRNLYKRLNLPLPAVAY